MKYKIMRRSVEKFLFSEDGQRLIVFHRGGKLVDALMFSPEDVKLLVGSKRLPPHHTAVLFDLKTPGGRAMQACLPGMLEGLERIRGIYEAATTLKLEVATRSNQKMRPMTLMDIRDWAVGEAASHAKPEEIVAATRWPDAILVGRKAFRRSRRRR